MISEADLGISVIQYVEEHVLASSTISRVDPWVAFGDRPFTHHVPSG